MEQALTLQAISYKRTRLAVLFYGILSEPLIQLSFLIPIILRKDLGASALQIAVLVACKYGLPSILTLYWSCFSLNCRERLLKNVIWAGVLSRIPFFFFPFIQSSWVMILAASFYTLFYRAGNPAWLEILKINLPKEERGKIFAYSTSYAYLLGTILPLIGHWMDVEETEMLWRWLFPISASLGLIGVYLQSKILLPEEEEKSQKAFVKKRLSWTQRLLNPWKKSYQILKYRKDFQHFQWGFMLCGSGILLIHPVVPILCDDILNLSYKDCALALSAFKCFGLAISSPLWGKNFDRMCIYRFSSYVFALVGLYPLFLLLSQQHPSYIYLAYLLYGMALGGNHLCWNLAGPVFSRHQDSSLYSCVNITALGLRACITPLLGSFIYTYFGSLALFGLSIFLCCFSSWKMWHNPPLKNYVR